LLGILGKVQPQHVFVALAEGLEIAKCQGGFLAVRTCSRHPGKEYRDRAPRSRRRYRSPKRKAVPDALGQIAPIEARSLFFFLW
jgi:hypothetical protein